MKAWLLSIRTVVSHAVSGLTCVAILLAGTDQGSAQVFAGKDDFVRTKKTNRDSWPPFSREDPEQNTPTRPSQVADVTEISNSLGTTSQLNAPKNQALPTKKNPSTNQNAFGSAWPARSKIVGPLDRILRRTKQADVTPVPTNVGLPSNGPALNGPPSNGLASIGAASKLKGPENRIVPGKESRATSPNTFGSAWPEQSKVVGPRFGLLQRKQEADRDSTTAPIFQNPSQSGSDRIPNRPPPTDLENSSRVTKHPGTQPMARYFSRTTDERTSRAELSPNSDNMQRSGDTTNRTNLSPVADRQRGWNSTLNTPTDLSNDLVDSTSEFSIESDREHQNTNKNILDPDSMRRANRRRPSSEVSPNHWGSLGQEVADQFMPDEQDPPIYDPATDLQRPKKSFREAWYCGRKFFSYDLLFVEPRYQKNSALFISDTNSDRSVSSDFKLNVGNRIGLAFESTAGPGIELFFSEFDQTSQVSATSGATTNVCSHVFLSPSSQVLSLTTFLPNETITVTQSTDLQYFDIAFFKFLNFPIAALAGHIGARYAEIDHEHHGLMTDGGGSVIGVLNQQSDFRGFGPKLGITYVRPIGHTRLKMVGSMAGSVLAGDREQRANDSTGYSFVDDSSEKIVSTVDLKLGVDWVYNVNDVNSVYARFAYESQHWFNGGTPVDPNSSFGWSGMVFGVGLTR